MNLNKILDENEIKDLNLFKNGIYLIQYLNDNYMFYYYNKCFYYNNKTNYITEITEEKLINKRFIIYTLDNKKYFFNIKKIIKKIKNKKIYTNKLSCLYINDNFIIDDNSNLLELKNLFKIIIVYFIDNYYNINYTIENLLSEYKWELH